MTDLCTIKICGSSTWCEICGLAWDTNDEPQEGCMFGPGMFGHQAITAALAIGEKRGRLAERAELIAWMRQDANESARNADIWAPASYEAKAMDRAADYLESMP